MAIYERSEFVEAVLKELGVIAVGETPTAEDSADVTQTLDHVIEMLDWEHLYTWDEPNGAIPGDKFRPLVVMVSNELASSFGLPADRRMEFQAKAAEAKVILERQRETYDYEPVEANYF